MTMADVYEEMGMEQLGECSSPDLMDDGKHPSSLGLYTKACEAGCGIMAKINEKLGDTCGNCSHWVGTDQYE